MLFILCQHFSLIFLEVLWEYLFFALWKKRWWQFNGETRIVLLSSNYAFFLYSIIHYIWERSCDKSRSASISGYSHEMPPHPPHSVRHLPLKGKALSSCNGIAFCRKSGFPLKESCRRKPTDEVAAYLSSPTFQTHKKAERQPSQAVSLLYHHLFFIRDAYYAHCVL